MAKISIVNTAKYESAGSVSSWNVPVPTGTLPGHLMIITFSVNTGATTITSATGFSSLPGFTVQTNNNTVMQTILYRICDGTEGSTIACTNDAARVTSAAIGSWSGTDQRNPFGDVFQSNAPASTTVTFPNGAPRIDPAYVVLMGATRNATLTATVTGVTSGFNLEIDACSTATSFNQSFIESSHAIYTGGGSITPGTATISQSNNQCRAMVTLKAPDPLQNNYQFVKVGDGLSVSERIR